MVRKVALLLVLLLCMSTPAYAVNFVEIVRDKINLIYIDIDSIEQRSSLGHDYIVAWVKYIPRGDNLKEQLKFYKASSIDSIMAFYAFHKELKQMQVLAISVYDKKGMVLCSDSQPFSSSRYEEIVPQSHIDFVYDLVVFDDNP